MPPSDRSIGPWTGVVATGVVVLLIAAPAAGHYVGLIYYPPAAADGSLYVAGSDGVLYALNSAGEARWALDAGAELTGPAVVAERTVVVGAADGRVVGAWPGNGSQRWEHRLERGGERTRVSSLATGPGAVYATTGRTLFALDPADGRVRWRSELPGRIFEAPATARGRVYVTTEREGTSTLYALSDEGHHRWNRTDDGSAGPPAVGPDGTVYLEVGDRLRAIAPSGRERWVVTVGDTTAAPAIAGNRVVVGTFDGRLLAVEDGTVVWDHDAGAAVAPAFGPAARLVYAVTPDAVIAVEDGTRRTTTRIGATVLLPPTVGDRVYVGTQLNRTYALEPDGSIAWIDRYATGLGARTDPAHEVEPPAFLPAAAGESTRVIEPAAIGSTGDRNGEPLDRPGTVPAIAAAVAVAVVALLAAVARRI